MHVLRDWIFLLIVFLTDVIVFRDYFPRRDFFYTDKQGHSYDLVVGILSAQNHFNLRQSLRETWVGFIKNHVDLAKRILVKFVISDQACLIPPEYRVEVHKCKESILNHLEFGKNLIAYKIPPNIQTVSSSGSVGRDFSVLYSIVISSLGISSAGLVNIRGNATVRLYDRITKKEIVNATFSVANPGTLINGSWFKPIPNFVLPKNFQATIVSENLNHAGPKCSKRDELVEFDDGGGFILAHKVGRFGDELGIFPEKEETIQDPTCPYAAGTFIYHGHSVPNLPSRQEKELRFKEWRKLKEEERVRLLKESNLFSDILFVPNIDVYRNLPSQLLEFYRWVSKNVSFSFTLKTDDDCFVDVERIVKALDEHNLNGRTKVWWSRFRTDWLVDRHGKWAEPDYPGFAYPTFACGAGNVLSADLVHWLANNTNSLKRYQGEDVSMGIWLSAIGPTLYKDYRWSCFQECFPGMFTSPEQDTESLLEMWKNLQTCDNPCSCEGQQH